MSMQEWPDDHLDELFRKSAEASDVPYEPAHWTDLNNRLDEHDRQGFYDRWRVRGGALALTGLLLITLWWAWKVTAVASGSVAEAADRHAQLPKRIAIDAFNSKPVTTLHLPTDRSIAVTAKKYRPTDSRPTPGIVKQPVATPDWAVRSWETAGQWRRRAATAAPLTTPPAPRSRVATNRSRQPAVGSRTAQPHVLNQRNPAAQYVYVAGQRSVRQRAAQQNAAQPELTVVVAETSTSTEKTTDNGHRSNRSPEPTSSTKKVTRRSGGFFDQPQPARNAGFLPGSPAITVTTLPVEVPVSERLVLGSAAPVASHTAVQTPPLSGFVEPEVAAIERPVKRVAMPQQRFSIMAVVSPDLSGIGLRDFTKPGTNAGLMVQYRITNRFSLQTGALISTKKYQTSSESYVWPATWPKDPWPSHISGTCTMYDIPLNLRYDWLLRPMGDGMPPARWFASAGLTSYFIRREIYTYDYANPNDPGIKYRGWDNQKAGVSGGKFGFSNLNVSVGYERPMGRHLSWQVEPFMKIPLQQVGFFKVRLLSTGAFIGLKYTL